METHLRNKIFYVVFFYLLNTLAVIAQQNLTGTLNFGGINRNYRLHLPPNYEAGSAIPLVFNFHGFTSNATQQELYSGMNAISDTANFAVCYPNGLNAAWNVGWVFGSNADDVGFISALIDDLINKYAVDPSRVYACGMSNGGFMSFRLACELNKKIAAVVSVTGSIAPGRLSLCKPGRSVPVMAIHGTADEIVPFNGSLISLPVNQVVSFWSENNRCSSNTTFSTYPNVNTTDNSTAEKYIYTDCEDDNEVVLIKIIGGGHTWPGATINNGTTNRDFNASEEIWNFFRRFTLPDFTLSDSSIPDLSTITLYPNPCIDQITIRSELPFNKWQIFDIHGKMVKNGFFNTITQNIYVDELQSGMYFFMLESNNFQKILKFVKQ